MPFLVTQRNPCSPVGCSVRSHRRDGHDSGEYSRARESEDDHAYRERVHAARTVACNARDVEDLQLLLSVLGLDASDRSGDVGADPWEAR